MVKVLGIQNNVLKELLIFLVLKELLIFIEHLLNAKLCPRCVIYNIINSRNIIAIMFPFLKIRKLRLTGQELYPKAWLGSDSAGIQTHPFVLKAQALSMVSRYVARIGAK